MRYFWIFVAGFIALGKGRNVLVWSTLTYFFGWFALINICLLPTKRVDWKPGPFTTELVKMYYDRKEKKSKPEGFKDFNTVDDLFKQLQTN
jgi:hypothetical protein